MRRSLPIFVLCAVTLAGCPNPKGEPEGDVAPVASKIQAAAEKTKEAAAVALAKAKVLRERALVIAKDPEAKPVLKSAAWKAVKGEHVKVALLLISLLPVEDPETGEVIRYGELVHRRLGKMEELDAYDPEAVGFMLMLDPSSLWEARVVRTGSRSWATPSEAKGEALDILKGSKPALVEASKALLRRDGEACLAALEPVVLRLLSANDRYLVFAGESMLEAVRGKLRERDWEGLREVYAKYIESVLQEANSKEE